MGKKLSAYYQCVYETAGLPAKLRLAQETQISSSEAAQLPDTLEYTELFQAAVEKILGRTPEQIQAHLNN